MLRFCKLQKHTLKTGYKIRAPVGRVTLRIIIVLLLILLAQGPALAFNPVKLVFKVPFTVVKLATKVAYKVVSVPVKVAMTTVKTGVKATAADKVAVFAIKHAPYKDLAFLAL